MRPAYFVCRNVTGSQMLATLWPSSLNARPLECIARAYSLVRAQALFLLWFQTEQVGIAFALHVFCARGWVLKAFRRVGKCGQHTNKGMRVLLLRHLSSLHILLIQNSKLVFRSERHLRLALRSVLLTVSMRRYVQAFWTVVAIQLPANA
eukprot:2554951-Pleurochrysis_carterae.AAC.4